jgi:hypothetical protein
MTVERKIVVGLEDIRAICFECLNKGCGAVASVSPDNFERIPQRCEQCGEVWTPINAAGLQTSKPWVFASFAIALKAIRNLINSGQAMGFRILLEFKEPVSDSSTGKPQPS